MTRGNRISVYWGGARGDLRISFCHLEACQDVTSKIHFFYHFCVTKQKVEHKRKNQDFSPPPPPFPAPKAYTLGPNGRAPLFHYAV